MRIWTPGSGVEWAILVGIVVIVTLIVLGERQNERFDEEHGCKATGNTRLESFIHVGDSMVPVYSSEKRCETGEVVWR